MTRIESGPTTERRVRTTLIFLMFAVFAGWFAKDGWFGYPGENFREHLEALPVELRDDAANARVYDSVNDASVNEAQSALNKFDAKAQRQALEELFGGPPSHEDEEALYYFGPVWRVRADLGKGGKLKKIVATDTQKSATSIAWQKRLGVGLTAFALIILVHLIRVFRTRLVVDEKGIHLAGRKPVVWDEIRSLKSDRFEKKGWVDLIYERDGEERTLRLDEYHLAAFPAAIAEICSHKGFEDPVALEKARKEAEASAT